MAVPQRLRRPLIPALVFLIALSVLLEIWASRRLALRTPKSHPAQKTENLTSSSAVAPIPEPSVSIAPRVPTPLPRTTAAAASPNANSILNAKQEAFAAPPDQEAMIEIDKISLMIRDYRTIAGENPVGTNAEIMAAVMGNNPKQAKLGPPEGMKLNEKGELIDRWGTPYFFHQISRDHMEIRSAGPDKILWTEDDPVIH
jgi:hypothetical protein